MVGDKIGYRISDGDGDVGVVCWLLAFWGWTLKVGRVRQACRYGCSHL